MLPAFALNRRGWTIPTLAAILVVSAFLRLDGVIDKGISGIDAANYVREGRLLAGVARASAGAANRWIEERLTGADVFHWDAERARIAEEASRGSAPGYAKPTHTLLVALSLLLLSDNPGASSVMSAIFGTATVALVFVVGRAFFASAATGLVAALVLGFSAYHVIYSREGLPDAENAFFFLLATYCYWRGGRGGRLRWLAATGLLAGIVYTANDRWAFMPLLFLLPEVWLAARSREQGRRLAGRLAILLGAMAAPLVLWEMVYYAILLLSRRYGATFFPLAQLPSDGWLATVTSSQQQVYLTYFEQLSFRLDQWIPQGLDVNLAVYPSYLWTLQGPLTLLLLLSPAAHSLIRAVRSSALRITPCHLDVTLWSQVLIPMGFFSIIYFHNLRLLTLSLPAIALLAAAGWQRWSLSTSRSQGLGRLPALLRASPALTAVALALYGLATALPALEMRTGLPEALAFLQTRGAFHHLSVNHPVSKVYLGEGSALPADSSLTREKAAHLLSQGYTYLVVSLYEMAGRDLRRPQEPSTPFFAQVFAACEPVHVVADRGDLHFYRFAYDLMPNPADAGRLLASFTPEVRREANRVYDLASCLPRLRLGAS